MNKSVLRVGLIGCGKIANRHGSVLLSGEIEGLTLGGVCDLDKKRLDQISKKFSVKKYFNLDDMVNDPDIDIIAILTESGTHASIAMKLAKYRKPVIVEKPMALTLSDADKMIHIFLENNTPLFVVKQNRYNLPIVQLKKAIDQGRFGKINIGTIRVRWCRPQRYYDQDSWRGTWSMDGGVISNQASHHLDMLIYLLGPVSKVNAFSKQSLAKIEAEDTLVGCIKFKSGAIGTIEATTATRPRDLEGSVSVLGDKGSVVIGGFAMNKIDTWLFEEETDNDNWIRENCAVNPSSPNGYAHTEFYKGVNSSLRSEMKPLIDGLEGRKSLELINALYRSVESGKTVDLELSQSFSKLGI
tara:strand:+ start:46 stop:1113 length:1068 start_codon:yes stop_codon:yes gene_type:complete